MFLITGTTADEQPRTTILPSEAIAGIIGFLIDGMFGGRFQQLAEAAQKISSQTKLDDPQ